MVRETRYLIVRNLPENCTEDIVIDHFQRYGKIQSVKLQNGKDNDSADVSTATVAFNDIKSAAKAHHAKNSIGEVTLRTDYWEGGTPVLASNPGTTVGSATVRGTSYTSSSATPTASRLPSSFTWGKGTSEDDVLATHEKGEASGSCPTSSGSCPTPTASAALDKLSSTAFDLQRGRGRERIKQKKFGQKLDKCGSFGRHGTITSARSLEASRSQSEAAVAAANSVVVSFLPSSSLTPATACHTSGSSSSSGSASLLNPIIITDTKDNAAKDIKEPTREVLSRSRPHSIASPSSRHSGLKKCHSHSRSISRSRSRSRGSSSSRSQSSGTSQSTTPHRSHTSTATRPQSMVGSSRLVNSDSKDFKKEDWDVDRRPLGICVSGLPARSSDTSIRDGLYHEYKKHGKVTSVQICGEEGNRCAIVSFKKPEDASKALEASQSKVFFGKSIRVTSHEGVEVEDADKGNDSDGMDEYHSKSTRTLFVGNLEKDTTAADLTEKFKKFGHIIDIDIKRQGATTAFAFVQYSDIASVVAALRAMEGEHIGINKIKLGFGKSMPTCCVWVDCLTQDISSRKLKSAMSRFGEVSYCCVDRKRLKALVHFTSYEDAQYCVSDIKQRPNFLKTKVQVDFASRECQNDFLDQMEKTGQIRANDRPDETGRTHKFRQQRSFDTFPDEGSPTLYTFTRTPTTFASRNNGRSSSGSSSYRRGRQYGETTFPDENHSSSRRTRWPEEFSQSGQFLGSKGTSDDYEAVLREYGHSQRERRERDLSPRPLEDRRVDSQSRQSSRDHSIDRYENNRNVDVLNSRDSSPGSGNSYHSDHRHRASRDDKYSTRDRYDDSKVEEKDSDRHNRLSRTASPFLRNQSRSHSHDSDYDHRGGSRSQSPPTPIQEDSSAHRIYCADDHKRSLNADGDYSVYSKSKDSDDKGKTISLHSSKLGAEVLKTAGKLKRREQEELILSDLSKLEKLVRKSDKSNLVHDKSQTFLDKDKKLHFDPARLGFKGHEQIGSPSSSGSHGDSENGSVSEGDLHHLHEEKHHILQKLQELSEEGVGISEPDSPQTAAKVKSVAVKEALKVSGRIHDDRKGEDLLLKDKKQGAKVREARRDSRNHELGWEDRSVLHDKNMSFSGAISDSDSDSALKRTKTRTESGVDTASKSQSLLRQGGVGVSDEEEADGKSDRSFKLHGSSVVKRLSCDSRLGSKSCSSTTKAAEVSCDSSDLFQGGFSDKDLTVIKSTQNLSKSDSYFTSRDWAAEYGGGEHSPVGCFSPANSDEQSQDSVTSGSLTEKSLKHLSSPSWQHSPLNSLLGQGHSETDYNYYKDFTLPGTISADSLSDDSLGEDVQPPSGEPSLEERIRAIDEMLNMTITNKSSDPSLLMSVLSNKDIANNNDNSVLYSKFRIRKREGAENGNGGVVADRKPEPSVIMQQVLSKKSILDQDIQRLEQMSEKYDLTGSGLLLAKTDLSALLRLPELKVDSCVKPVLSPSLLSFSSPSPLISSVPVTTSSSSSVLLSVATAAVAGSAISSAVFSGSVLTTSSVSTPVTTCSIHVSSKPSPTDSSSRFLKVKTLEGVEDLLNVHTISSDSLTLKPDSVMSPLPTSSVCVLTCSGNLFSSSSSSSSSPVLNSVIGSPLITDSSLFSSVGPHNFKFVTSTLPTLSSALSPVSSTTSNFLSNLLHHKPNSQQSVSKLPYTSSSLSLPSSSSLSVSPSTSGISAAAPFTQGPDKSQLTPIVGQEAPHLCSPSFTPENSRTSFNSHLPGSRSPRILSQKSERDDGIRTSSKVDLNISVSSETYSKPDIERNAGSSISPDIESPVSVQSETSSTSSVPLSSLDIKSHVRIDEKSDVIACTSLSQPGVLAPHGDDTNILDGRSVQESGLQHSEHDLGTCVVDGASNKDKLKSLRAVETAVKTVEATSFKAVSSQSVRSISVDHILSDAGLANATSIDIQLKSASIGGTSVLQSSSSSVLQSSSLSVLQSSNSYSGSSSLKSGALSSGSQSTECDAAATSVPRSSNQIPASSKMPSDRNDKKVSVKSSASNLRISNSLSKPEALFAPDLKTEQAVSKTDVRHHSQKSTSIKSSSDKKSSKTTYKETNDGKSASGREMGKSEKTAEQDSKSIAAQEAASKGKDVNKVKDKSDQSKESEKLKQKEKEENKKKDVKKSGDKKIEKRSQVGSKDEKQAERKPEDRKDKTHEKSKEPGKVTQTKHSKHESKPDSSVQSKDKSKEVGSKVKEKDKSGSKISEVKHGKTPSKSDSKVKSSKNESLVKSDKENTQKPGVQPADFKEEVHKSVKIPEVSGKLESKESFLSSKSDSKESVLSSKSDSKESVLSSKSESKESMTMTPLKKAPEVKAKKEPQKENCKQTPAKQGDKNQKVKQTEKHRTKESKHQNENEEIIMQKLNDEKELKEQEEKEKKEKDEKLKEERLKEQEEAERKQREKEEKERQKEKEKEERERQIQKEEKEKQKEEKERLKKEREERERQKKEEREQREREREEKERQKEKEREEKLKQKKEEKEERERQKEKEREEKEKQKEKEREEKERQKVREKEEKERQREKERLEKEKQKEKEREEKEKEKQKEREEKIKEELVEQFSEKDNEKKKEKEDKLKIKGGKEKEKTEKIKEKKDIEKKTKKEQVQKEKEEKAKEEKAKKEREEKIKKDKEKAEKKEQEQKKVLPKKPKRNELAALLEHNDMIQMSFTSMYDRVKTQRNREPEAQHKTEPAPKSSFDTFRQNRKKGGSKSHELYSFDTSSDGSGDLSSLSEDSEPEQKPDKSELSSVKETKPKKKKPIKRPHLSSSSSGEEDEVALLRATKSKGKKQDKSFSEIFSSDSDDDNFQPPVSTVKSAKQKSKPASKKRKTRDDSSDSMTSRDESVKANVSLATDSLGDLESSDDEIIKKKKKTIKSNDADDKTSSTETLVKKKIISDVSIESTTPKTGKANKEEKTPKKSKPESKKSPKTIQKLSVSKDEVKSSNERKKNRVESGKNDNKMNTAVKLEATQLKVDDEPKLKSKFEPEVIKTKTYLKDKQPEKLKAKENKTKLTNEGKSKAEEKHKNKLESASKAGLSKVPPESGSKVSLSKPVASSDKKTDIENIKLVEEMPPKVKSDEKQKSKEVEVKFHSEKVKAERDKRLEGKAKEEETQQNVKKIAVGTTKTGVDNSVKLEVDSNSTMPKSCQEVMSVDLDIKKSKVKSAVATEIEKSLKVDGEMEVEDISSKTADVLEKKVKVSGERKKKIEEKDDGLVKKKKKKKFDLSIEEELVNSLITKVYDRDKKKKKINVLDSESDDTAQSEHSQEPSRPNYHEPSKNEEDMELVMTTEEKDEKSIVSENISNKQATEFKPVEQSMELVTDQSAEVPKKKHTKKKEKREPEKEVKEEDVQEVKLEQQSIDLADVTKPPKKKKKKKDHDEFMDAEKKEKAGKPAKTPEKKSEAQKSEEKKSGNISEDKSGSQIVDEFTSFWGHPKPILIPKRLKDSKKTDDDKCNSKEPRDESKMKGSTEKTDLLTEVKEEPGEGREKQSPSGEDALCDLYLDLDKKPPTPRLESELDASSEYVVPISEAETTVMTELGSISALDSVSSSKYSPEPEESSLAVPDEITLGSSVEIDDDDLPSLIIDENTEKVKGVKEHQVLKKPLDRHDVDSKKGGFSFKDTKSVASDEDEPVSLLTDGPTGDQEVLLSDIINQELKYNSKISNEGEQKSVLGSDKSRHFSNINSKEKKPGLVSAQKGLSAKDKSDKISAVDSDKRKDTLKALVDTDRKKDTLKVFGDLNKRKDSLKALGELDKKDTLKTLVELDKRDTLKTSSELDRIDTLKAFGPLDEETKKRDEELLKTLAVLCDPHLEQPVVIDVTKDIAQEVKQTFDAERKEAERKKIEEHKKIEEKKKAEENKLKAEEEKKKEEEKKRKEDEEKERAEREKKLLEEEKKRTEEEERKKAEENKIRAEEEKRRAEEERKKAEEEKKRMEEEAKKKAEEDEKNRREKEEQLLREASDEAARAVESLLEFQSGYESEPVEMEEELPPLFIESAGQDSPLQPVTIPSPPEPVKVSSPPEPVTVSSPPERVLVSSPPEPVIVSSPMETVIVTSPPEPVIVPLPQENDKPKVVSIFTSPIPEKVTANLDDQLLSKSLEEIGTYESGETKLDPFLFPSPTSTQVSTPAVLTSPRRNSATSREPTPEKMISPKRIVVPSQPALTPSHRMQFPQRTISSSPQHSQGQSPQRSLPTQIGLGSPPPAPLHTPSTSVSLHATPGTVPLHTPPMTGPLHALPGTVHLHAQPISGPLHAAPLNVALHTPPTSVSHHAASPALSLHNATPPVPLLTQTSPASVIQMPPVAIPATLQSSTPLPPRPAYFSSQDTKIDRNYLLGSPEVPPHSDMDISLGPQHRRLSAGLIVQSISEPPVRPMAVSPRRKSQEFGSEQHILASRRNTIAAPEEASMTYLDRAFPTYVGPDMILSKEHTQGTSSLPPPVSISLDKMPHDSDSQSSLSLPSNQDNLLLSPKKMSPGFQFKERLPEPPLFHSVNNKSLMQESSMSHFAKGASPDNVFSAYAARGSSHEQLLYGSKGHPGASSTPDFFKSHKFPDQQTILHVKSAMNEKTIPAQPIKIGEPLLPQKNPVQEFVLPHGKASPHVLEQYPLQPESKNVLVREPLFSPKSQPDNPLNYPDQNIDFLLNSPPRNSVSFSHFPPNTEVNLPLVQKQPDYNLDPLFISPSENSAVRQSEREHLPRRSDGFPASFYQEPVSASKPHQDTVTVSLQHPLPSLATDDDKKNTRKRKRNSRKTTNEDRAAALAEQQAIEQSVQANVDSIRKALNANQAKAAAEKAGVGGVDKKKSLDAYDFEPDLGQDFASHPAIPTADLLESEPKSLRSRGDRGRGRAMGTRRGRRGRGAMSSVTDLSDSINRPEPSLFPSTVSPFSSHSAHSQDHLSTQLHHHYHHPHSQQQQQFPRPVAQPNSIGRPLPQFFSNPPTSLPSDPNLNLPASADWQVKQSPLPHLYQHKAPQQIVQPPAPVKMASCPSNVMSPESNKQDLDLSYGESELIINLDDQPLSSEGKENQQSLSSDGEGNLTLSPSTPKSQRSTRTRKQPDYKAIASGNSQVPVQPRSSRSGGSPRAAGNGAQSPKSLSPRTRSSENVSSPVVKLEKLEVGRTTRSRREAAGKGHMKDIINDGSGRLEDGLIKGNLDEGRSLSKENIYEFVDNEQELLLESSLRSSRARKNRNSGSQELAAQQTMPDYMPGSPVSSSNSSLLFGHEHKHGFEPQPPELRAVEESAKMSNVDAIIEAVSKGNFGIFEECHSCETVKPGCLTDADQTPVPAATRSTRRSTEFKKEADEKVEKFAVAENVRPETREACRKALESKEANRKVTEGKEGSRKGPTVPPLIIKVNEEKHYVIERAKGEGPPDSEKPPLAFTVKLSDSGTATIKPAGGANVAQTPCSQLPAGGASGGLTPCSQLPAAQVKPPVAIPPDATKVELPPKKDGNSLGLFSGLPQSEQQANSEIDHTRSTVPVSQAQVRKPPEVVHDEPVISKPTGALHPKVAAKVHASQEIQNSLSQNQQASASVSQSATSALQAPNSTAVAGHQPFISNSTQLPAPKSSPVTPATPLGLKHGWAAGMQQQEPQLQLPTSEPLNSNPYLPQYLQQQMSQLSSPMPREAPLLHKPQNSGQLPEVKLPPNAHSQPILRPDLPGNAHSQQVLRADLPGKVSKPGGLEINSDMAAKLASEVQKHHQSPFSFPPHVPPAHSGQRSFVIPADQPGHLPSHFTNSALLKAGSDTRPAKSPSIQSQLGAKMVADGRTQTPPVTSSAMLYAGVVSGQPHSLSPTTASPEGQVIERIQNPLRSEAGQSQSPLGLHVSGSHLQDPGCRFIKDDGQDSSSSLPVHNERTSSQQMVMLQMLEHQRLQQHLIMAEAAARNSAPDSARLSAMRTVQELARSTPVALESSRKGPMTPSQSLGLSQPLNLTPQSDSRVGQPDPSRVTPKSTPPAPQSPFSLPYFDRSKADSGRLSSSVAGPFMQPSPGGHREGLPPHVYSELSIANLTAHNTYMVSRLPIDPRIYGSGQQPHLMRDGVLSGSFPQSFPPGSRFPGLEHPDGKKEQSHSDQPGHHLLRSPSPIQRLQADALRQQLTRMPCDLTARESPVGFLQRYPVMWQGALALKNDNSYVQMHFIAGNRRLPNQALPQPMQNGALPPLRISQRMRLEHAQLEGVAKRMQCEEHYCILIAVACGRDQIDINHQTRALNDGFITYLLSKQAAGIVNVPLPGSEQVRFVVHIFPPCEFVDNSVAQQGSVVLMEQLREVPHAVVIIATT